MSRDKAKDDKYFNCQQEHELEYVSSLYGKDNKNEVYDFLKKMCDLGKIKNSTHKQVYEMIENEFKYKQVN